ncbi:MAG: putative Ig domain-containing protein [Verrucomicrobiae bacterium]|nr:putative Ig domain-containing protein [Verrucomicrobiae bacterium]
MTSHPSPQRPGHPSPFATRTFLALALALAGCLGALSARAQGPIQNGQLVSASISPAGDVDNWTFAVQAGDAIVISMGGPAFSPRLRLYDPDNIEVADAFRTASANRDVHLQHRATKSGTYTVLASSYTAAGTGDYILQLIVAPGTPSISPGDDGGPLVNGGFHTGVIALGDSDPWTFEANAGDKVVLRMGTSTYVPRLRLFDPNGAMVAEAFNTASANRDIELTAVATNAGPYTVVAAPYYDNGAGEYSLSFVKAPGAITITEGDQGGPLTNGGIHPAELTVGDLDAWTFSAAAGDRVILRMGATGFVPRLRLYDPNGALVSDDFSTASANRDTELSAVATNAGPYTVVASAYYPNGAGPYTLSYAKAPGAITVSPGDHGGPLTNGGRHPGSLSVGDIDAWTFDANAGDRLILRMGTTAFVPRIRLFGPDGAPLGDVFSTASASRDNELAAIATASGPHTVVVAAYYANGVGDYHLSLARAPGEFVVFEGDQGGPLTNGARHPANLAVGDLDLWTFNAQAGGSASVRVGSTGFVPHLRLFDPNGALVANEFSTASGTRDMELFAVTTNAGPHTVVVSAYYAGAGGDYDLTFFQAPGEIVTSEGDEGGPLTNGMIHAGTLPLGDIDTWTFFATPGDSNNVAVTTTGFGPWLRLFDAQGRMVAQSFSTASGNRTATIAYNVTNGGPHTVTLSAYYSGGTGTYELRYLRFPPDLNMPDDPEIPELVPWTASINAQDPLEPTKPLTFNLLSGPPGLTLTLDGATNAVLNWTPTEEQAPGTYTVEATVTDLVNGRAFIRTNSFTIVAREVNTPPILTVPGPQSVDELTPFSVTVSATDSDLPPNPLTFSLASPPEGMTIDPASGVIHWTPSEADGPGTYEIRVVVTDESPEAVNATSLSVTNAFTLTVNEVNSAPVLPPVADRTVPEGTPLVVENIATDADLPPNLLTYSLVTAPPGAAISQSGVITWTPTEAQGPSVNLFVTVVTDNGVPALSATNSFTVTVIEVNHPPVLTVPADQTLPELSTLNVSVSATDPDLPANPLTFSLASAPSGMTLDPATGAIAWTPTEAQGPSTNLVVVVVTDFNDAALTDQRLSVTNSFTVVVTEVNEPPVLGALTDRVAQPGIPLTFTVTATDPDLPANTLTFALDAAPDGMTLDPATGVLTWSATPAQIGTHTVTVRVSDDGSPSLSDTGTFDVLVTSARSELTLERIAGGLIQVSATGDIGETYELQATSNLTVWERLAQFELTTPPYRYIDPASATAPLRFYRLYLAPRPASEP